MPPALPAATALCRSVRVDRDPAGAGSRLAFGTGNGCRFRALAVTRYVAGVGFTLRAGSRRALRVGPAFIDCTDGIA